MLPPAAKKAKLAHNVDENSHQTDYRPAGVQPDTRLIVFGVEILVCSEVLKAGSTYFRKFMDPPNTKSAPATYSLFKYTWYTKVDEDGTWCMTSDQTMVWTWPVLSIECNVILILEHRHTISILVHIKATFQFKCRHSGRCSVPFSAATMKSPTVPNCH